MQLVDVKVGEWLVNGWFLVEKNIDRRNQKNQHGGIGTQQLYLKSFDQAVNRQSPSHHKLGQACRVSPARLSNCFPMKMIQITDFFGWLLLVHNFFGWLLSLLQMVIV